jgi:hypothetical protein
MKFLQRVMNFLTPVVMSRIVSGPFYRGCTLQMYQKKMLVTPGLDLAPGHVNCARVIFMNTQDAVLQLELLAAQEGCELWADSVVYYGTTGRPIVD